jgi:hypothetical protein
MRPCGLHTLLALRRLRPRTSSCSPSRRWFSHPVVNVSKSNVYRFGDGQRATPALRDVQWTVNEGESWVITGAQRNDVVEVNHQNPAA